MKPFTTTKHIGLNTLPNGLCISTAGWRSEDSHEAQDIETCLFFANGSSDVIAYYSNEAEAIAGHHKILMSKLGEIK
jgi:hypothetical protein